MRTRLSVSARVIDDELSYVYGDEARGLSTVEPWSKLFRTGQQEIEEKARPGRPVTETTAENIEEVRLLIDDDRRITREDIQEQTDLSYGTVQRIIVDHLKFRQIIARYVPKDLTGLRRAE